MHVYLRSKPSTRPTVGMERALELGSGHLSLNSCSVFHQLFDIEHITLLLWVLTFRTYKIVIAPSIIEGFMSTQYVCPCCSSCIWKMMLCRKLNRCESLMPNAYHYLFISVFICYHDNLVFDRLQYHLCIYDSHLPGCSVST